MKHQTLKDFLLYAVCTVLASVCALPAYATGRADIGTAGFSQITTAVTNVQGFLQGPLASGVLILAIIIAGGMWVFNKRDEHSKTLGRIAIGAILIFLAPQVLSILGLGGAGI